MAHAATLFQQGLKETRVSWQYVLLVLGFFLTTVSLTLGCHFWAFPDWGAECFKTLAEECQSKSRLSPAVSLLYQLRAPSCWCPCATRLLRSSWRDGAKSILTRDHSPWPAGSTPCVGVTGQGLLPEAWQPLLAPSSI